METTNEKPQLGAAAPLVMEKNAFWAMCLGVEAAGGLRFGSGNPWSGKCGCLLSVATMIDNPKTFADIYVTPQAGQHPVLTALYEVFGMPPAALDASVVFGKNDKVCPWPMPGESGMSWSEFAAIYNIVPSL